MIITQTPFRISLTGGGTDIKDFYEYELGAVISFTIDKYIYVTIHDSFNDLYRISYSKTEIKSDINDIEHDIIREALKSYHTNRPIEITTVGDIPAGSGLGSSSTLTVGLLTAIQSYTGRRTSLDELAHNACKLEIDTLKKPIGKQDQWAATFGGLNLIEFYPDEQVRIHPIDNDRWLYELERHSLLIFTDTCRDANTILKDQKRETRNKLDTLRKMRDQTYSLYESIKSSIDMHQLGMILNSGWEFKRSLTDSISNHNINEMYSKAIGAGAWGGKLLGAGGGGFLFIVAPPSSHNDILARLNYPKFLRFRVSNRGTAVIFDNR